LGLSDSTVVDPLAFPDSTTTYTVTVSVGSDCIFSDSIVITVNALPIINAGTDTSICPGDSVQLFATGGSTYEWSPAVSLTNAFIANPLAFPNAVTTYAVTGTDLNGCKSSDSLVISLLPSPVANAGADTALCLGDSVILQATGGTSFQWTPSNTLTDATAANPIAFPATTTNYIVKVNDGGTCFGYDSVTVIVYPLPNADAGNDTTVCSGSTIQLNGSGGTGYSWSPTMGLSASTISNPNALVDTSISYTLMVTDLNGCQGADTIHLAVVPSLNASIGDDTSICAGTTAQLFAAGGATYSWFPPENLNNSTIPTPVSSPDSTTTFSVIITDGICYADTLSVNIGVSTPVINAGSDAVINPGEGYQLLASGTAGTYAWSPPEGLSCINCLNPVATPQQTTTYTITVTDALGCTVSDEITLSTSCGEDVVYIPNAFTPNNNGKNDVLFVRSDGVMKLNYLRIFDRWGTMVFESNDINDGWDGTYRSEVMSPGVYVYMAEVECGNGDVIRKEGNVTLLR
jgi:gliding motility-associated-like protein